MNIFFILWYISIIWFDFFYHWRAFSFFHMHISNLKGTFQPQPSPLFQKTGPPPLPNSPLYTLNFSAALCSQGKNMHIAVFCWIQEFWNLEFNQACFNVGTGRRGDGWGRGSIRPKEFALTHTSHFWLEKSYSPTNQMVWCGGNIPLSERKSTLCHLLLLYNPFCVNILKFSVPFQLNNSFISFWFNMKQRTDGRSHVCLC